MKESTIAIVAIAILAILLIYNVSFVGVNIGTSSTSSTVTSSSSKSIFAPQSILSPAGYIPTSCYSSLPSGSTFVRSPCSGSMSILSVLGMSSVPTQVSSSIQSESDFSNGPSFHASLLLPSLPATAYQNTVILKSIVGITGHSPDGAIIGAGWIGTVVSIVPLAVEVNQPTRWTWLAQSVVYDASSGRYTVSNGINATSGDTVTTSIAWAGSTWTATTGVASRGQTTVISVTGLSEWALPCAQNGCPLPDLTVFVLGASGSPTSCAQYPSSPAVWSNISPPRNNSPQSLPTGIVCGPPATILSPTSVQVAFSGATTYTYTQSSSFSGP